MSFQDNGHGNSDVRLICCETATYSITAGEHTAVSWSCTTTPLRQYSSVPFPEHSLRNCKIVSHSLHYKTQHAGELKPSQHLGLARLASKPYDRVARLPLQASGGGVSLQGSNCDDGGKGGDEGAPGREGAAEAGRRWYGGRNETGLVVAYWSYDYRDHAMGYLTRGLFCSHQASHSHGRVGIKTRKVYCKRRCPAPGDLLGVTFGIHKVKWRRDAAVARRAFTSV